MNAGEVGKVYGALLCSPGMTDIVKVDLKITRRLILLLAQTIERGIATKNPEANFGMIEAAAKEELEQLTALSKDCLDKAGLGELYEKLKTFQSR